MADSKITDLPILTTPSNSDVLPIVDLATNTTKQIAVSSLGNSFTGNIAAVSANWGVAGTGTEIQFKDGNVFGAVSGSSVLGTEIILGSTENTGLATTARLRLRNVSPATSGLVQSSPANVYEGYGWNPAVSASQPVEIRNYLIPTGTLSTPAARLITEGRTNNGSWTEIASFRFGFGASGLFFANNYGIGTTSTAFSLPITIGNVDAGSFSNAGAVFRGPLSIRRGAAALPQTTGVLNLKAAFDTATIFRIESLDSASTLVNLTYGSNLRSGSYFPNLTFSAAGEAARIQLGVWNPTYMLDEVGIGVSAPTRQLHVRGAASFPNSPTIATALNSPFSVLRIDNAVPGTPVNGIGTRMEFGTRVTNSISFIGNAIDSIATNVASGVESFDFSFRNSINGSSPVERFRIKSTGAINFAGIATDPTGNSAGDVYYNSTFNSLELFNGTAFVPVNTTRTIATFTALENHPVSANFATLNTRNFDNVGVLQFAAGATIREARFISVIPDNAVLVNGLLIRTQFSTITATSGSCRWGAQIKKLSSTSYAASAGVDVTVSGTANQATMTGTITLPSIDSLAPGDAYALRIFRESSDAADTLVDSAQLLTVEVRTNI